MTFTIETNTHNLGDGSGDFIISALMTTEPDEGMKQFVVRSPLFDISDRNAVQKALDIHFINVSYALRQRQFPEDTMIWDATVDEAGNMKIVKQRYPEE